MKGENSASVIPEKNSTDIRIVVNDNENDIPASHQRRSVRHGDAAHGDERENVGVIQYYVDASGIVAGSDIDQLSHPSCDALSPVYVSPCPAVAVGCCEWPNCDDGLLR